MEEGALSLCSSSNFYSIDDGGALTRRRSFSPTPTPHRCDISCFFLRHLVFHLDSLKGQFQREIFAARWCDDGGVVPNREAEEPERNEARVDTSGRVSSSVESEQISFVLRNN